MRENFAMNLQILCTKTPLAAAAFLFLPLAVSASGIYTKAQSNDGESLYKKQCATCHHLTLKGSGHGPELAGSTFKNVWGTRSTAELYTYIETRMPPGGGSINEKNYVDILAYILFKNGLSAGDIALQANDTYAIATGKTINAPQSTWQSWSRPDSIDQEDERQSGFINQTIANYKPVTTQLLANPPASDWLNWRRTLDGKGYSPLKQINRDNVTHLKLSWSLTMQEGSNQLTPLIHDGVMFLTHPGNIIQAIDASNGELIWEFRYSYPPESRTLGGPTRAIALYQNKVFMATYDAALVAIDASNGQQLWKTIKADYKEGFTHTSGPVIASGVVVSGINGCERFVKAGCFITGHDPDTGKELWRTSTIAQPNNPHGASWGDIPVELRAGGDTWIPGSYDPSLKLFYIGTAQAKPWVAASRGMSPLDAALYTNSTLAINPQTGKIAWHYQHVSGETLDMDTAFERVLVDINKEKLLFTIGKDGILWKLNRETGKFIDYVETIFQNIFEPLDKNSGKLTYRPDIISANIGDAISFCPGIYGGHNWQATAYHPENHSLIIPQFQLCSDIVGRKVELAEGGGGYGGDTRSYSSPNSNGMLGKLSSINMDTMELRWNHEQEAMFLTSVLTTGGGLAFVGDLDRYFKAFDVNTGEQLWQTRLGAALHGYPVSYSVNGKQYIAVATGLGVFRALTASVSPGIYQPEGGNALYVFELNDSKK